MTEYIVDSQLIEDENNVLKYINALLDNKDSFYFKAGAGSGKTYALIEAIRYYVSKNHPYINKTGQKVACITYTNAAKNEVNDRLYDNENVLVCTIHSFLWNIIRFHQKELIAIHEDNLLSLINEIKYNLNECTINGNKNSYKKYRKLNGDEVSILKKTILEKRFEVYNLKSSSDYWTSLNKLIGEDISSKLRSNKQDIDKILRLIIRLDNYLNCISKIKSKDKDYLKINYLENGGKEILHKNLIGHDTLIDYGYQMIINNDVLKKIIIDSFPLLLIDEYQDTHTKVIKSFDSILSYAIKNKLNFILCMFGDPVQSIYSNNIEKSKIENDFITITKNINRRSHTQIVDTIDKIRGSHQDVKQKPIYKNRNNGDVKIYLTDINSDQPILIRSTVDKYLKEWKITNKNRLTCLVLKNKTISTLCDFEGFYNSVYDIYKEIPMGFDKINEEFMNINLEKLGPFPNILLNLIKAPYIITNQSELSLPSIFDKSILSKCNLKDVFKCVQDLNKIKHENLFNYYSNIFELIKKSKNENYSLLLKSIIPFESDSLDDLIMESSKLVNREVNNEILKKVTNTLNISINEVFNWYSYLMRINNNGIDYLTCHSSKGLEFDNVLVFLEDKFGKNENKSRTTDRFTSFFELDINTNLNLKDEYTRNLLYVTCSRAKKNLRVVLFSIKPEINETIRNIFHNQEVI